MKQSIQLVLLFLNFCGLLSAFSVHPRHSKRRPANARDCRSIRLSMVADEGDMPPLVIHHAAIKTRNITLATEFYGLLGFRVSTRFRAGPARAAWLEFPNNRNGCRLELIEVPSFVLNEPEGMKKRALDLMARQDLLGYNHMALDVTDQIVGTNGNLTTWLQALNQTSLDTSNRMLRVALEPQQQIIGQSVYELAFLYDADGALVELLNKQAELDQEVASGWEPWDGTGFQQT